MPKLTDSQKRENKEFILEASCRCFSRKGYHKTSMRDIAKEANLSLGAIYVYFETKNEIVKALVRRSIKDREQLLNEIKGEGIASYLMKLARIMDEPNGMEGFRADIGVWAALLDDNELRTITDEAIKQFLNDFSSHVIKEDDEITSKIRTNPILTTRVILGIIQGGAVQKVIDPSMDINRYFEIALHMIKN